MWDHSMCAQIATALIVVTDPVGNLPIFISLTSNHTTSERKHAINIAVITAALTLIVSVYVGEPVLVMFGISVASFRVAGGIIVMLMAIAMLQARPSEVRYAPGEADEAAHRAAIAVVPLGIPLIAGPGAISTVIIYAHQATGWLDFAFLTVASLMVCGLMWLALRLAASIRKLLGLTGINVVTRLMGLILTAVAVEFITSGLAQLLPGLTRIR